MSRCCGTRAWSWTPEAPGGLLTGSGLSVFSSTAAKSLLANGSKSSLLDEGANLTLKTAAGHFSLTRSVLVWVQISATLWVLVINAWVSVGAVLTTAPRCRGPCINLVASLPGSGPGARGLNGRETSHLIAASRGRHNGASTVINGAQLPPQRRPFTLCHHSRPSLPGSLMALELPFIPLSPQPLSPVPLFFSLFFWGGGWEGSSKPGGQALLSRGVGPDLCDPGAGDSPPLCFGPLSPLPRQIRARPGHGEREPPGVSLSSHSHQRRAARSGHQTLPYSHTHSERWTMSTQSDSSHWERNACESRSFKDGNI